MTELTSVVALDGPAGSGKSTVARAVAAALGWRFVDTGATYRAVTLGALRAGVDLADGQAVAHAAEAVTVELSTDPAERWVRLDGEDVTSLIREPEVSAAVSAVSAVPQVRALLIDAQRRAMGTEGAVVEGRDIATVVAPLAAVKVYLDASPEVRATRRAAELTPRPATPSPAAPAMASPPAPGATALSDHALGDHALSDNALSDHTAAVSRALATRDALDNQTNRLEASDGAVHLDTSDLTIDEVVERIVALVKAAGLLEAGK